MKNYYFTISFCTIVFLSFSQEKTLAVNKQDSIQNTKPKYIDTGNPLEDDKNYTIAREKYMKENPGSVKTTTNTPTEPVLDSKEDIIKKIQQIDSHINSINIKSNYILNDPAQKLIAEEEGWFEQMKSIKESLEFKKLELQKSLEQ